VCEAVLENNSFGILICGTGVGMCMAANRFPGIRAALCAYTFQARACREHNDANVICIGERVTGPGLALEMIDLFLSTPFSGGRHARRIALFDPLAETHSPSMAP
jgi:ribose 5-phosphate isomerase B